MRRVLESMCAGGVLAFCILTTCAAPAAASEPIQMVRRAAVSPDGSSIVFSWAGDIWRASSRGGPATALTSHAGGDRDPHFSPDGQRIAFVSNRTGRDQLYEMAGTGSAPRQVTRHSEGFRLLEYAPDDEHLLAYGARDHFWRDTGRMLLVSRATGAEEVLFDAHGEGGRLSPDGKRLLYTREGTQWFRKGYRGTQASQIWIYDVAARTHKKLLHDAHGYRYPIWKPDGTGFYYSGQQTGSYNLWEYTFAGAARRQLTRFEDDSVLSPSISLDGSVIVFRRLADLYRYDVATGETTRLALTNDGDSRAQKVERRSLTSADNVVFSPDGLEIAFAAGGDIWVMDTELREPVQVTHTPEEEREPVFAAGGATLLFVSDAGGQTDLWTAARGDVKKYWWQNDDFVLARMTENSAVESWVNVSPDEKWVSFVRGNGELVIRAAPLADGKRAKFEERVVHSGWDSPYYSWSPDSKWLAYSVDDNDFNTDIWITPIDGSRPPFNVSRHPDNDRGPVWSPDGKVLAFTGRRSDQEVDIYYAWLRKEDEDQDSRDRTLQKALEKMKKEREKNQKKNAKKNGAKKSAEQAEKGAKPSTKPNEKPEEKSDADPDAKKGDGKKNAKDKSKEKKPVEVTIDFDGLEDRIRRISIADSRERSLFWMDATKLAFSASVKGASGIYTMTFPDKLTPKLLTTTSVSGAQPLPKAKKVGVRVGGSPALLDRAGKIATFKFRAQHERDVAAHRRAGFDQCWVTMRDNFYDQRLGNRNWDAVREKYRELAANAVDAGAFGDVINMMLGELNGSHLSFRARGAGYRVAQPWSHLVAHLGVHYDANHAAPGWKIAHVLKGGPAAEKKSRLQVGEVILSVDGMPVDASTDKTAVLLGPLARDVQLRVRGVDNVERDVTIRPINYGTARRLQYRRWIDENQRRVSEASANKLGYLHIRGMNWSSFLRFEEELYKIGAGKDGLVIDVRANGGGFTTDHLLTILTQPTHSITVPRGGGEGYPHDRRVYATWDRPIIVLCDQNSFSNAEIFAHAIKSLDRGQLVGVATAGGVISTGGRSIMDLGSLRMPFRGWYLLDGEDMELNGAAPDHVVWAQPGELIQGTDTQLDTAIRELLADVATWQARPKPTLRKSSQRPGGPVKTRRAQF